MLGRERDLAALTEAISAGRAVVVVGEAGIGKTTLARAALDATDMPYVEGGCLATLSWMSYLPLQRALGRAPDAGFEDGDAASVAADVAARTDAGILFLDDLQWADSDTLATLASLSELFTIAATVRSVEPGTDRALKDLAEIGVEVVTLGPLDGASAAALVRRLDPAASDLRVHDVVAKARGNPLFVEELALADDLGPDLRRAVANRLSQLSPRGRDAVLRASLLGRPGPPSWIGPGCDEAAGADLLVVGVDSQVELRHAVFAEVAVTAVDDSVGQAVHRDLARLVTDPGEAAHHHLAAGELDQARTLALVAAAATPHGAERAESLAVAARASRGPEHDRIRLDAAAALVAAGDPLAAEEVARAVQGDDPTTLAEVELWLARAEASRGDAMSAERRVAAGIELVAGSGEPVEAMLRIEEATLVNRRYVPEARAVAEQAWAIAERLGVEKARARSVLGVAHLLTGSPSWREHQEAAMMLARETGEADTEFLVAGNLAIAHFLDGDWRRAEQIAVEEQARARAVRRLGAARHLQSGLAFLRVISKGEYEAVIVEVGDLHRRLLGEFWYVTHSAIALAFAILGRHDEAAAVVAMGGEPAAAKSEPRSKAHHQWARAEAAWLAGRSAEAAEASAACLRYGATFPMCNEAAMIGVWARFDLGEPVGPPLPVPPVRLTTATIDECEGVRALQAGAPGRAAEAFSAAADTWAAFSVHNTHRARWAQGEALRRAGAPDEALAVLLAVEADAEAYRHAPLLGRIRRSLRPLGVNRQAAGSGNGSVLTYRQHEILELVGEGLSSAEIGRRLGLSPRTVDSMIDVAADRLGATTRIQASVLAREDRAATLRP